MRRICILKQPYRVVRTSRGLKQGTKKAYELLNSLFTKITEACWKRTFLKRFSISKIRRKKIVKLKKMRFKKFQLRKKNQKRSKGEHPGWIIQHQITSIFFKKNKIISEIVSNTYRFLKNIFEYRQKSHNYGWHNYGGYLYFQKTFKIIPL